MPQKTWTLTDVERDIFVESFSITSTELGLAVEPEFSISKRTLRGGLRDGVDIVVVDNGVFRFTVLPTRGMGIWKGHYGDLTLGWDAPVRGPVNPRHVDLPERGGLGWLQGFDEWICRCGLESNGAPCHDTVLDNNGNPTRIPLHLHGRIANLPAHFVEVTVQTTAPYEISVRGHVDESMLFCPILQLRSEVVTRAGSNTLEIRDEVVNSRDQPAEFELLYHCNFGPPLLEAGSRLVLPVGESAPRDSRAAEGIGTLFVYEPPTPGYIEQVFWHRMLTHPSGCDAIALLENANRDRGVALRYDSSRLPCFTQWKNTGSPGEGYVTGLEPGTDFPNSKPFERERGRVLEIPSRSSFSCSIAIEVFDSHEEVKAVEDEIEAIQRGVTSIVHNSPQKELSDL